MAADATRGARIRRHADTGEPLIRDPPDEYVGQHQFVPGDDNPTMPPEFLLPSKDDLPDAVTAYLPRVGTLDAEPADEARGGDFAVEKALCRDSGDSTQQRAKSRVPPAVLDGLRRL